VPKEVSSNRIPAQYKGMLTAWHQTNGIDAIYLTVIDPTEHSDLYKVDQTLTLLADFANEKRLPR
jgi:hypothetical protein